MVWIVSRKKLYYPCSVIVCVIVDESYSLLGILTLESQRLNVSLDEYADSQKLPSVAGRSYYIQFLTLYGMEL
jgi:hypothetical protein